MILSLWAKLRARYHWHYVGTVKAQTLYVNDEGETTRTDDCRWLLVERGDGSRRSTKFGDPGTSEFGIAQTAAVAAWEHGGPIPNHCDTSKATSNTPAKLLVFPGGKDPAA